MLHACFTPIHMCFVYTSLHFYMISGTNLLTRCHSASSLFSAVFVFQKSCTGNILGIGRNKSQSSYFSRSNDEVQRRDEGGPRGTHTMGPRGSPCRAVGWCGALVAPQPPHFRLFILLDAKTLNTRAIIHEKLQRRRRRQP